MFCNYCGASNPDDSSFCNACGKTIARPPAHESLPQELAPVSASSPQGVVTAAVRLNTAGWTAAPQRQEVPLEIAPLSPNVATIATGTSSQGTLTEAARAQLVEALVTEIRRKVEDKTYIWAGVSFTAAFLLVAGINKVLAPGVALVGAGLVFKFVKDALEKQYLRPIVEYSDQMLHARLNEAIADRNAGARAATWVLVIIIFAMLLFTYGRN